MSVSSGGPEGCFRGLWLARFMDLNVPLTCRDNHSYVLSRLDTTVSGITGYARFLENTQQVHVAKSTLPSGFVVMRERRGFR